MSPLLVLPVDAQERTQATSRQEPAETVEHLKSELAGLLDASPRLLAARNAARSADMEARRAYGGFLPTANLTMDGGYESTNSPTTRSAGSGSVNEHRRSATLTVTQNLFAGWSTSETYSSALALARSAQLNVDVERQGLLLEGITLYYSLLKQQRLLELANRNEANVKQQLQMEDARVQQGTAIAVDVLQAKSRLQLAAERRVLLSGQFAEVAARYRQLFGHPPDLALMKLPDIRLPDVEKDLDAALALTLENNPSYALTGRAIDAAEHARNASSGGLWPRIDLEARGNWESDVAAVVGVKREWSVLLKATWILFDGLSTLSGSRSAAYQLAARQNEHSTNLLRLTGDVQSALNQLKTARERVQLLENAVVIGETVLEAREKMRDSGRESALAVLDAQSQLFDAYSNRTAARFDAQLALYRALGVMGLLTPEKLGIDGLMVPE
jgi:adhesin transport system outer membrane protein